MGEKENIQQVEKVWLDIANGDFSTAEAMLADNCIQEWPQSGERIRGKANILAINENYPGIPKMTLRRTVAGGENLVVSEIDLNYGGKAVHGVSIFELEGGKIVKETDYFADPFEAPEWRAKWVEKM